MEQKKVNVQMLEPQPNNGIRTIDTTSSQTIAKPLVMRRFVEEDLVCWQYYKSYLIDILNGDYELNEARSDLAGLVGSKYDVGSGNGA